MPGVPSERATFYAYRAESRGFERVTRSFAEHTGDTLGAYTGVMGTSGVPVIPDQLGDEEYLALTFSLPAPDGANSGQFGLSVQRVTWVKPTMEHEIIVAISPCPGDFRPRDKTATDPYLRGACRTPYEMSGALMGGVEGAPRCPIPAGQTMYMNIALRDLYRPPTEAIPPDRCEPTTYCGMGALISN